MKKGLYFTAGILFLLLSAGGCSKDDTSENTLNNGSSGFPISGIIYQKDGLWTMNTDGTGDREFSKEIGMINSFSSSLDGSMFAYHRFGTGLMVVSKDGQKNILSDALIPQNTNISWSNDGKIYLSYFKGSAQGGHYIFSLNADGSGLSQVTPDFNNPNINTPYDDFPSLAPDNAFLLFTSQRSGNGAVLNKMDMQSNQISYLSWPDGLNSSGTMGLHSVEAPSCSPDGTKIIVAGYSDNLVPTAEQTRAQIYKLNPDGSGVEALTHFTIERARFPAWSPDGKQIVFQKDSLFYSKICIMNADGSNLKVLGAGSYPCFIGQPR